MPKNIPKNLWLSIIRTYDGDKLLIPLMHEDMVWLDGSEKMMAISIADLFNKSEAEEGKYLEVMKEFPELQYEPMELDVQLDPSRDGLYPAITLHFIMYCAMIREEEYIGHVLLPSVTAFGKSPEELRENMHDNLRLELARKEIPATVAGIISTQWFKGSELVKIPVDIKAYSLNEIEAIQELKKNRLLPEIAAEVRDFEQKAFFLDREVENLSDALFGKFRKSVLIVGRSGVGKTALLMEFLRQKKQTIGSTRLWQANAAGLINKLMTGGGWHDNLSKVCQELREYQDMLYIENFSDLFEVGQYRGSNVSIADYLQDYIKRGDITVISECTEEELAMMDVRSPGYSAHFYVLRMEEPGFEILKKIISQKSGELAHLANVIVSDDAIAEALILQKRFMPYSGFPGKTIRFLEALIIEQSKADGIVQRDTVLEAFCEESGMPRFLIDQEIELRVDEMESHFKKNIYGQHFAIETVVDVVATFKAFLSRGEKPIASLFFIGPTGVGKTEMAKVMAEYVFGSRKQLIRFDMSEFSDPWSVLRLTGDSYTKSGLLTDAVRREPFSVVLFDELEKAHYSFYDLLLQVMGEGRLTDARGELVDFCSTIIIMTSNIGATTFKRTKTGFRKDPEKDNAAVLHFESAVQKFFRPELFNRIDQVVGFLPLNKDTIRSIVNREIDGIKKREGLLYRGGELNIEKDVLDYLGTIGYDAWYGARQLQRTLRKELIIPLSFLLNEHPRKVELKIDVLLDNGKIAFNIGKKISQKKTKSMQDKEYLIDEVAEEVTRQRRAMQRVRSGNAFMRIQNQLAILKHKKNNNPTKFSKRGDMENQLYKLEELTKQAEQIFGKVEQFEQEAVKVLFGFMALNPRLVKQFHEWINDYEKQKINIYDHLYPSHKTVVIGIYGKADFIDTIADMYLNLAKSKNIEVKVRGVFFQGIPYRYQEGTEKEYASSSDYTFVGFELEFSASAVYLYFNKENGLHKIETQPGKFEKYVVIVEATSFENYSTPFDVHRQSYFQQRKNRRTIAKDYLEDHEYRLVFQGKKGLERQLINYLSDEFMKKLNQFL